MQASTASVSALLAIAFAAFTQASAVTPLSATPRFTPTPKYCSAPVPTTASYTPIPHAALAHVHVVTRHGDRSATGDMMLEDDVVWKECVGGGVRGVEAVVRAMQEARERTMRGDGASGGDVEERLRELRTPCDQGQLTITGIQQHERLGRALRHLYVDRLRILPTRLTLANINTALHIRSTDVPRTRESIYALLAGLYRPGVARDVDAKATVHMQRDGTDSVLVRPASCPRLQSLRSQLAHAQDVQEYLAPHSEFHDKILRAMGDKSNAALAADIGFLTMNDAIRTRYCHGMKSYCHKGECVSQVDAERVFDLASGETGIKSGQSKPAREAARLISGGFLADIASELNAIANDGASTPASVSSPASKFTVTSAHDTTIHAILSGLGASVSFAPYASTLIFELWRRSESNGDASNDSASQYLVRMILNSRVVKNVAWCDFAQGCPLGTFLQQISEKAAPKDLAKECRMEDGETAAVAV